MFNIGIIKRLESKIDKLEEKINTLEYINKNNEKNLIWHIKGTLCNGGLKYYENNFGVKKFHDKYISVEKYDGGNVLGVELHEASAFGFKFSEKTSISLWKLAVKKRKEHENKLLIKENEKLKEQIKGE